MAEIDFEKMSEAELRQLGEETLEDLVLPIERMVANGADGTFACPRCAATASWTRKGRDWSTECLLCEWSAAGTLSPLSVRAV
jgi:hypothetical protein